VKYEDTTLGVRGSEISSVTSMGTAQTARCTFNNILVPTDWSDCSVIAMQVAEKLARQQNSRLWVAHVAETTTLDFELADTPAVALNSSELAMERFLSSTRPSSIPLETVIEAGNLWNVLSHVIEEHGIDLIVTGTHGRGWLQRALLGSAAELIVRNANCPVLTVSSHMELSDAMLNIVFPTDLSSDSIGPLRYATEIANDNNAQLAFVHVVHGASGAPVDYPDELSNDDDQYAQAMLQLRKYVPDDAEFRRAPELLIESDVPADGILKVVRRLAADLIIMPVRHQTMATRSRRAWGTASRIIAHAPCPVLTISE
jgi:nucleotide-binding universal stress UspA family protein